MVGEGCLRSFRWPYAAISDRGPSASSAVIYACTTLGCVCFPWGIPQLQSDWSRSCDHGLDYAS